MAAALIVATALLVYIPALRNGFIWDDPLVLQQLRAIHGLGDLVVMPPQIPRYYYRPLIFVSYLIDRSLGGEVPFWFHLSVIALHALNCLLVSRLAMRLFDDDTAIATGSAVLFAVVPTHVESVAWMAGRSDVIVCAFLLLTMLVSVRRDAQWSAWIAGFTLFLALLSKELAVAGLFLVPVLDWSSTGRLYWARYPPLLVATIAYFVLRQGSVGALVGGAPVSVAGSSLLLDLVRAAGYYIVQTVVPIALSPYVPSVPDEPLHLAVGVLVPVVAIGLLYRAWPRSRWPATFLLAWFAFTLAPSFTVILRRSASAPVADRYLYVPSVASCMLFAWAIVAAARRQRLSAPWPVAIFAVLTLVLGVGTATYAGVWTDNFTFWSDVVAKAPENAAAERELAWSLTNRGQLDEAKSALQRALTLPSDAEGRVMAYGNLGLIERRQGHFLESVAAYESALQITPHPVLYHNLGMTLMAKAEQDQRRGDTTAVSKDVQQARTALETALSFREESVGQSFLDQWDPAKTHALLGQVLNSLGDRAGAREHLQIALRLQPTGPVADVTRRYLEQIPP